MKNAQCVLYKRKVNCFDLQFTCSLTCKTPSCAWFCRALPVLMSLLLPHKPTGCVSLHRYLIKFLSKLTEQQEMNKMTPGNIAIVLGPNLLWMNNEGYGLMLTASDV